MGRLWEWPTEASFPQASLSEETEDQVHLML